MSSMPKIPEVEQVPPRLSSFAELYDLTAGDAAFLWILRCHSIEQPHHESDDVKALEFRIQGCLDFLLACPEIAWEICFEALSLEERGEMFCAAVLAFKSADPKKIKAVVTIGLKNQDTFRGLVDAMVWLPSSVVYPWQQKLLSSKELSHKYLAITVFAERREDPGEILEVLLKREDCLEDILLHARILRLIGELKLHALKWAIDAAGRHANPHVRFWALWSAILLGDTRAIPYLFDYCCQPSEWQEEAIQLGFRVVSVDEGRNWISKLVAITQTQPDLARIVIHAIGIMGDPHTLEWLLEKMSYQHLARLAAKAFCIITGIDLEKEKATIDSINDEDITNDDEWEQEPPVDPDENLLYPNVKVLRCLWEQRKHLFTAGQRYFIGEAINTKRLNQILQDGYQEQRHAAALELALLDIQKPLINTRLRISTSS